jgi:hypothetical protein
MPDLFRQAFLDDIKHNLTIPPSRRRDHDESMAVAFILRTLCPQSDEFQRHLLPFPQIKVVDEYYAEELDRISQALTTDESLPGLLDQYQTLHGPEQYVGRILPVEEHGTFVVREAGDVSGFIPAMLAIDRHGDRAIFGTHQAITSPPPIWADD